MTKQSAKEEFCHRLNKLMRKKRWSQSEFARRAGLPRNAISVYLRGASLPNSNSLAKLAQALGVDADTLLPTKLENGIDRNNLLSEFYVIPSEPKMAQLRISRTMPTSLALKILTLIEDNEAADATNHRPRKEA
jgi:transcriptional regulator with XRE-family HTH domain